MKKLTKSHSTFLDSKTLEYVITYLNKTSLVKSFTAGIIKVKRPPSKTVGPVKILLNNNHILLRVNTKSANQEMRIYGDSLEKVKNEILEVLTQNKIKFISS